MNERKGISIIQKGRKCKKKKKSLFSLCGRDCWLPIPTSIIEAFLQPFSSSSIPHLLCTHTLSLHFCHGRLILASGFHYTFLDPPIFTSNHSATSSFLPWIAIYLVRRDSAVSISSPFLFNSLQYGVCLPPWFTLTRFSSCLSGHFLDSCCWLFFCSSCKS